MMKTRVLDYSNTSIYKITMNVLYNKTSKKHCEMQDKTQVYTRVSAQTTLLGGQGCSEVRMFYLATEGSAV